MRDGAAFSRPLASSSPIAAMMDSTVSKRAYFVTLPVFLLAAGLLNCGASAAATDKPVDYNRDVRPILSDTCFKCHGFDPSARKGKLRLDKPEDAFADRGGYAAIVPGHPEKSEA